MVRINHLGDYGTQFGKLIVAFKLWGDKETVESNPIPELLKLYVRFHDEAEVHPEMEDEARAWFTKLENGDEEAKALWQWFRDESLKEFSRVYDLLDIEFPEMEDEARAWFTKLENGDEEAKALWQWFRDESLKEFSRVYDLLDIEFDSYAGESFYSDKMDRVIDLIKEKGLLEESEGTNRKFLFR